MPNTVVLATLDIWDKIGIRGQRHDKDLIKRMIPEVQPHTPFSLMGQEGWETLAPLLPVQVRRTHKPQ